jgi:hypothetical protein
MLDRTRTLMMRRALAMNVERETRENLALVAKSIVLVLGGLMAVSATVELVVGGVGARAVAFLLVGLALAVPPLGLAFRDAVRHARRQRER